MSRQYEGAWWRENHLEEDWKIYEDFRYFLVMTWRHLDLPDPTPIQLDIASYLQHGPERMVIEAFRGVGKSWVTSAFVVWLLLRDPQLNIMVVSASKERADQFSTFTLGLIRDMEILRHLYPEPYQRQSKIAFDVAPAGNDHAPSVKSSGIFGQLAGSRADVIISDDVEVPNNSETQGMRDKLGERVKEFSAILKPLQGSRIIYLGTPQCEDSLYNQLPERGYQIRVWPSTYPDIKQVEKIYGDRLAPMLSSRLEANDSLKGQPTDPLRFGLEDLDKRQADYGRSGFALQFQLDTRLSDADRYPLKLSDLLVTGLDSTAAPERLMWARMAEHVVQDLECVGLNGDRYYAPAATIGDWVDYSGAVMFIDPSGKGKDETGYAVVKMLNGNLFLTAAGGLTGGYDDETLTALANIAKEQKVNLVLTESNFGDGMFDRLLAPFLRKIYPCTIESVRAVGQKELRIIQTLEPVMNQHKLIVDRLVIEKDMASAKKYPPEKALKMQLFYQMSRITKDRGSLAFDDRLDAVAGAVKYWTDMMGQDETERMDTRRDELFLAALHADRDQPLLTIDRLAMGMSLELARKASDRDLSWNDEDSIDDFYN